MKRIEVGVTLADFATYLHHPSAPGQTVLLTRSGAPFAVLTIVDAETLAEADDETVALSLNPQFLAQLERGRHQWRAGRGIPTEEVDRLLAGESAPREQGTASRLAAVRQLRVASAEPAPRWPHPAAPRVHAPAVELGQRQWRLKASA